MILSKSVDFVHSVVVFDFNKRTKIQLNRYNIVFLTNFVDFGLFWPNEKEYMLTYK